MEQFETFLELHNRLHRTYQPVESKLHCQWLDCMAGGGLAGSGSCFLGGGWWMPCCPAFQDEEETLAEWERRDK